MDGRESVTLIVAGIYLVIEIERLPPEPKIGSLGGFMIRSITSGEQNITGLLPPDTVDYILDKVGRKLDE